MTRHFIATKVRVANRGVAPDSFLNELIAWGRTAPDDIFAPNAVPIDIYTVIKSSLATWDGLDASGSGIYSWDSLLQRRAAMLEVMRVHAGMESSWNWNEGVDVTNAHSLVNKTGAESGIFQVSFDSTYIGNGAMKPFAQQTGIERPENFIEQMKQNHPLALEYYARLVRVSIAWAGPLLRHGADSVYPWLSRSAVAEFEGFLE